MISQFMTEIENHDSKLSARGYTSDDIANAKALLQVQRTRDLQSVVCNIGTVSQVFSADTVGECARVLLLYALGASDHFEEPSE